MSFRRAGHVCGLDNRKNVFFNAEVKEHGIKAYPSRVALIGRSLRRPPCVSGSCRRARTTAVVLNVAGADRPVQRSRVDGVAGGTWACPATADRRCTRRRRGGRGLAPAKAVVVKDAARRRGGRPSRRLRLVIERRPPVKRRRSASGADVVVEDLAKGRVRGIVGRRAASRPPAARLSPSRLLFRRPQTPPPAQSRIAASATDAMRPRQNRPPSACVPAAALRHLAALRRSQWKFSIPARSPWAGRACCRSWPATACAPATGRCCTSGRRSTHDAGSSGSYRICCMRSMSCLRLPVGRVACSLKSESSRARTEAVAPRTDLGTREAAEDEVEVQVRVPAPDDHVGVWGRACVRGGVVLRR